DILTDKKDQIQNEVLADLQDICNRNGLGVAITGVQLQDAMPPEEVKASFLDVTSAKEDKAAKVNEARRYENEKLPVARGDAQKIIADAEAYKQARINEATGIASRYRAIAEEYEKMPSVMRMRMYIEMITEVLPRIENLYIVDGNGNTVQFLPLNPSNNQTPVVLPQE
ncbi:MAG TPA: protease modulator HflK, partial [Clostridiales bacterium]|nr:protease modulator HflK [Clostridiales bacterium]